MRRITERGIVGAVTEANKSGRIVWVMESLGRGAGSLALKATPQSRHWYYRTVIAGTTKSYYHPLGPYGGTSGLSLADARAEAQRLAELRRGIPDGDLRAHFVRQAAEEQARKEAEARAREIQRQEREEAGKRSLRALVNAYTAHLEQQGKATSANDALRLITRHVLKPFPAFADAPAHDFTRQQATEALRSIVEKGKGRTAGKVRSYLRAAYALALRAESDPAAPSALIGFDIQNNPVADTAALSRFNKPRDRALSEVELKAFWKRLQDEQGPAADALRVMLLCGGQRITQVLRAAVPDFDTEAATLTLSDPKGRREQPRRHLVPLPVQAAAVLEARAALARGLGVPWLFTSTGKTPTVTQTVHLLVKALAVAMVERQEAEPFGLGDLRRSVETHLARLGISRDLRAQIQSHGLGGVQSRHYDRHDYLEEKRTAINAWAEWLTRGVEANVVPLKTKQPRKGRRHAG